MQPFAYINHSCLCTRVGQLAIFVVISHYFHTRFYIFFLIYSLITQVSQTSCIVFGGGQKVGTLSILLLQEGVPVGEGGRYPPIFSDYKYTTFKVVCQVLVACFLLITAFSLFQESHRPVFTFFNSLPNQARTFPHVPESTTPIKKQLSILVQRYHYSTLFRSYHNPN